MKRDFRLFIPSNEYGLEEKYYSTNEYVDLLRQNKNNPDIIQFLADMLEE